MRRFKSKSSIPATPKSYTHANSHKMTWPNGVYYDDFLGQVIAYAERNGIAVPTDAQVQDQLCRQMSKEWCVDEGTTGYAPVSRHHRPPAVRPCKSCGGRR